MKKLSVLVQVLALTVVVSASAKDIKERALLNCPLPSHKNLILVRDSMSGSITKRRQTGLNLYVDNVMDQNSTDQATNLFQVTKHYRLADTSEELAMSIKEGKGSIRLVATLDSKQSPREDGLDYVLTVSGSGDIFTTFKKSLEVQVGSSLDATEIRCEK